jgi:hypothetical protein
MMNNKLTHCMCGCIYEEPECPRCNKITDKDRIEELEAKLAKAVEALDNVVVEYDLFRKYEYERGLSSLDDEIEDARTTLAELKGDNQ